jgi:hypothetical protein
MLQGRVKRATGTADGEVLGRRSRFGPVVPGIGWSVVAQPVVERAQDPAVLLGGLAIIFPGHDVVDLTALGRQVAVLVGALEVSYLDGPASGPDEKA